MKNAGKEKLMIIGLLLAYFMIFNITTIGRERIMGDAGNHAAAGLLVYEVGRAWLTGIAASPSELLEVTINHHAHYRSFASFLSYTPLHQVFMGIVFLLAGPSKFTAIIPTILEAIVLIYFVYRIALIGYKDKGFAAIAAALAGFSPFLFFYSTTVWLETGSAALAVVAAYFTSHYVIRKDNRSLYMAAATSGLAILMKPTMVLVPVSLFLVLVLNSGLKRIAGDYKTYLKAFAIMVLVLSPWLAGMAMLQSNGLSGMFINKWVYMTYMERGAELQNVSEDYKFVTAYDTFYERLNFPFLKTLIFYASFVLFQWYLAPFILFGAAIFFMRKGKVSVVSQISIVFSALLIIYLSIIGAAVVRYAVPTLPFVALLAARSAYGILRRPDHPIFLLLIILSVSQCALIINNVATYSPVGNFDAASVYIIDDTEGQTSVVTSQPRTQALSFALLDTERKVFVYYIPEAKEELDDMIGGNYTDPDWERFGMTYPPIGYIIVHESSGRGEFSDYVLKSYAAGRQDFELVRTIEGEMPSTRIFIYKRKDGANLNVRLGPASSFSFS